MKKIYYGTRKLKNYNTNNNSLLTLNSFIINDLFKNVSTSSRLKKLFIKILWSANINQHVIINTLESSIKEGLNDQEIINKFKELVKKNKGPVNTYNEKYNIKRAESKWAIIKPHIKISINSILDFGGNVGDTAITIGKLLGLSKEKINVVDINEWAGLKWEPRDDITFTHYNNLSNIKDKSIDLITIFHSLHHIKENEYNSILDNFNRILSDKGIIILYEHNNNINNINKIIDIEHCLYDVVMTQQLTYDKFINDFYAKYLQINEWESLFSKYFKKYYSYEMHNIDNSFYMFLRKK